LTKQPSIYILNIFLSPPVTSKAFIYLHNRYFIWAGNRQGDKSW